MGSLISKVPHAKMYQIIRRGRSRLKSVNVDGRVMKFGRDKLFHVKDQAIAQAIADKYPHDTMSIPHDSWRDDPTGVHSYTFAIRGKPECEYVNCHRLPTEKGYPYCDEHGERTTNGNR